MTTEIEALRKQRIQDFITTCDLREPKRVPIDASAATFILGYAGVGRADPYQNLEKIIAAHDKYYGDFYSDIGAASIGMPVEIVDALGGSQFFISSNGHTVQHHEDTPMQPEDYDAFIKGPLKMAINVFAPRKFKNLRGSDDEKYQALKNAAEAMMQLAEVNAAIDKLLTEKFGLFGYTGGVLRPPLDIIFDRFRGFKGLTCDLRRYPEQVKAAMDALYDYAFLPNTPEGFPFIGLMTHCPTFIRKTDFEKFYWPFMHSTIKDWHDNRKTKFRIHLEEYWGNLYDYLDRLPDNLGLFTLEKDDPFVMHKRFGKKAAIAAGVPDALMKYGSKEECVEYTKRLFGELAPGGGFVFMPLVKGGYALGDFNPQNLNAVLEYADKNAAY